MIPELKDKSFVITGGSSGIGQAFKNLCLAQCGRLQSLERRVPTTEPEEYSVIPCDLKSEESMRTACERIDGHIDVFAHFAGIMLSKSLPEAGYAEITEMMQVNLIAPMYLISQILPKLSDDGLIILLGSQSAYKGSYDDLYAVSKSAIHGLVGSLAPKLAPHKRIINVAPGITRDTRMTDRRSEEDLARASARVPLNRLAEAKEIAEICMQLCDRKFSYMTGNTIDVNGGNHIR